MKKKEDDNSPCVCPSCFAKTTIGKMEKHYKTWHFHPCRPESDEDDEDPCENCDHTYDSDACHHCDYYQGG